MLTLVSNELLQQLDLLLRKTRDRECFLADVVRRSDRVGKCLLNPLVLERKRFAFELDLLLVGQGPPVAERAPGVHLRRALLRFGEKLAGSTQHPLLYRCYLAEYLAVRDYEGLLRHGDRMPHEISMVLLEQRERTREAVRFLERLRLAN